MSTKLTVKSNVQLPVSEESTTYVGAVRNGTYLGSDKEPSWRNYSSCGNQVAASDASIDFGVSSR